jgi:hypothetical protein
MKINKLCLIIVLISMVTTGCSLSPNKVSESCGNSVKDSHLSGFNSNRIVPSDATTINNVLHYYNTSQSWVNSCGATIVVSPSGYFFNTENSAHCRNVTLSVDNEKANLISCLSKAGKWELIPSDQKKTTANELSINGSTLIPGERLVNTSRVVIEPMSKASAVTLNDKGYAVDKPSNGSISIWGSGRVKRVLVVKLSVVDKDKLFDIRYQWKADNKDIKNANDAVYRATEDDLGKLINVTVNYTNAQGTNEAATSNNIKVIK